MNRSRAVRAAVLGALVGVLAVAGMVGSAFSAPGREAQATHRAAIVVDTGSGVVTRCVTFSEDSISGITALQRAGLAPVVRSFSGNGGAVCGLNGLGCPADSSCLTCQAPNYWAYYRADDGAGAFSYSPVGAGSAQVTDGDVEGWRWGSGAGPGFRSFASICPLQPPLSTTTTTTTAAPRPGGPGNGSTGRPAGGPGPGGPPDSAPGDSSTTVAPTTSGAGEGRTASGGQDTDPADGDAAEDVDGEEAAARTPLEDDDGSGASARTWLAFVALLGGFGLAGWRVHRVRRSD